MADYRLTAFRRWHLPLIIAAGAAEGGYCPIDDVTLDYMERAPTSWTLAVDGEPSMAGGALSLWPGRWLCWAYLAKNSGPHMTFVVRASRRQLATLRGRLEMVVREDFAAGHKFARILGFDVETPRLRQYGPAGEDFTGYVRFNQG